MGLTILIGARGVTEIKTDIYAGVADRVKLFYEQAIQEKSSVGVSNAISLSFNDNIKNSLLQNDRDLAIKAVKDMSKKSLKTIQSFKIFKFIFTQKI